MNIYQAEEFFNTLYNNEVSFDLDAMCYRNFDVNFTEGVPNQVQFITYEKLQVTPNNQSAFYFPIDPHRVEISFTDMQALIGAMT
jgi:hypothetical protein